MFSTTQRSPHLNNSFRLLWGVTGISNLGDGIGMVALPLLAASLTRDPVLIASVAAAQRLPWLLFSLISGVIVDRSDRRRLQRAANAMRALVLGLLGGAIFLGWASIQLLIVVALLLGIAETLFDNAAFALLPAVVDRGHLEQANSRLYTTQTVANEFIGPPLGGGLFAIAVAAPILAGAILYGLAAGLISLLCGNFQPTQRAPWSMRTLGSEIAEGVVWFWGHRLLHALGIKAALEHGCWAATNAILVLVAQDRLGLDAAGFGLLLGAGAVGGVLGGLSASWMIARMGAGSAVMLNLVLQCIAYLGIALSTHVALVGLMLGMLSYTGSIGGVVGVSFRQAIIPNALLGRVSSAFRLYALGAMAIGAVVGGWLAKAIGLLAPYWISSFALLVLAVVLLPIVNNRMLSQARQAAQPNDIHVNT
jgi:MFS family permease